MIRANLREREVIDEDEQIFYLADVSCCIHEPVLRMYGDAAPCHTADP